MNFTLWISRRFRLNGSGRRVNATGIVIATVGVSLALIIMELTIAIVLGFKHRITEKVEGFEGQVWVLPDYNYNLASSAATIEPDSALLDIIERTIPQAHSYMRFSQPGMLKTDTDFAGIYFTGFDPEHNMTFETSSLAEGEFPDFSDPDNANKVVISRQIANDLGLKPGDDISACFFVNDAIRQRKFHISGIYETGFGDYDRTVVFAPITTLRKIAQADSTSGTKMSIDLPSGMDISQTAAQLQEAIITEYQTGTLDKLYPIDNVRHTGALYFNWLDLLDTNVVVIFILMICVSGFTLVSSMFIIILERIPTIGILRALGTTRSQIRSIFVNLTMKVVGLGLLIGNIIGMGIIYIQDRYSLIRLDPEMYYLHYVPVEIGWHHILLLNIGVIVLSWLILIVPSRVASNISPAVTMRFE